MSPPSGLLVGEGEKERDNTKRQTRRGGGRAASASGKEGRQCGKEGGRTTQRRRRRRRRRRWWDRERENADWQVRGTRLRSLAASIDTSRVIAPPERGLSSAASEQHTILRFAASASPHRRSNHRSIRAPASRITRLYRANVDRMLITLVGDYSVILI